MASRLSAGAQSLVSYTVCSFALLNHLLQGVVLAATFAVSHNVESTKPVAAGSVTTSNLMSPVAERDWGVQQVSSSLHQSA